MHRISLRSIVFACLLFLFIVIGVPNAFGKKPPWAGGPGGPGTEPPPVSAPEPTTLSLIGVAIAGGVGYYFNRRKHKK